MATRGKNIQLFLMDGEASGRIKCTLANWTGVAFKIPRTELDKCKDRDDLKQSGVYFLFGTSDETGKGVVYIGQAGARKNGEGILNRLMEHKRNPATLCLALMSEGQKCRRGSQKEEYDSWADNQDK